MRGKAEFLKPGHYLAVAFREGPVFFRITGREIMSYEPYEVGVVQAGSTTDDIEPTKPGSSDRLLEPENTRFILHTFVGVAPEEAEVYLDFPPRVARYSLRGTRSVPGNVKWIDGVTSPFEDPDERSELISFHDLYPAFKVANQSGEDIYAMLRFEIAKYTYRIIRNYKMIDALIEGKKACKIYTFLEPYDAPSWLVKLVGDDLFKYASAKWNELMGTGGE